MSDEDLMAAYARGDEKAFRELFSRHSGKVYAYMRRRLSTKEEADEVFQNAFLKLHQSKEKFRGPYPFTQWLYVISKSVLIDHLRAQKKHSLNVPFLDSIASTPDSHGSSQVDLARLGEREQETIRLRAYEEKSFEEIAVRLGVSPAGARQIFSRAVKRLRSLTKMETKS